VLAMQVYQWLVDAAKAVRWFLLLGWEDKGEEWIIEVHLPWEKKNPQ